ncbi:unnamed protein product, partial [Aphanomyces euteiches]
LMILSWYFGVNFQDIHGQFFRAQDEDELSGNGHDEAFRRAVVVYFPNNRVEELLPQFLGLRRSWLELEALEPKHWRTDLVVYTNGPQVLSLLEELGCKKLQRQSKDEPNRCVVVPTYKPLTGPSFSNAEGDLINIAAMPQMDAYHWILRTDMHAFLMPAFALWKPSAMTVSHGTYTNSLAALTRVARDLNMSDATLTNIGLTWYGPTRLIQSCATQAVKMIRLIAKVPDLRNDILLHASHLAINQCTKGFGIKVRNDMLEFRATSLESPSKHAHVSVGPEDKSAFSEESMRRFADNAHGSLRRDAILDYTVFMALDGLASHNATSTDKFANPIALVPKSTKPPKTTQKTSDSSDVPETEKSFVRAAVVFLPVGDEGERFLPQLRWFLRSWQHIQPSEPTLWRTDVVVFTNGPVPELENMNCTVYNVRKTREEPNRCVLINTYKRMRSAEFDYQFGDSIGVVAADKPAVDIYDWILRTDMDTFLTPAFATWKPKVMTVGRGAYTSSKTNAKRLTRIIKDMGLHNSKLSNVGSTWYGPAKLVRECAKLTVFAMKYLHENEFTALEKSKEYGLKGWPEWHYGVLSMYGGHIAINHCTRDSGVVKDNQMLDFPSSSEGTVDGHAHLHTWQDNERFSKFVFEDGGYKDEKIEDQSLDKVSDYAMYMALDSQETSEPTPVPIEYDPSSKQGQVLLRAIAVFLPPGKDSISSLRLLHRSWKEMLKTEPKLWRTDLVVFTNGTNEEVGSLGCTSMYRGDREYKSFCVHIDSYNLVSGVTDPLGNGINIMAMNVQQMAVYEWILRTDVDTLVTPAFAAWLPSNRMVSSWAPYLSGNAAPLARISTKLGLNKAVAHIGSTWYGEASLIRRCAKLTVKVLRYLESNEFQSAAKSVGDWRETDREFYALAVGVGHCTSETGIEINSTMFDISTTSSASPNDHAHLRSSVESGKKYNRLDFAAGAYADINLDSLDRNVIHDYAMYMALKSHCGLIPTSSPPSEITRRQTLHEQH